MENKQVKQSYGGMVKDLTKSKFPNKYFYDAKNIKITATNSQSTYSVTNEKGNELILTIPEVSIVKYLFNNGRAFIKKQEIRYNDKVLPFTNIEILNTYFDNDNLEDSISSGTQLIIGQTFSRGNIVLFTTDNNGFDCIWKVNDSTYDIELLYLRNLGFNILNPIQALNNYENEIIDKVYWVDGNSQMRFINIYQNILNGDLENLIDNSLDLIQITGTYITNQPEINRIAYGGSHTSGMIQYAYNLYRINGSQTKLSPLSKLISLNKGDNLGGGDVNEIVGSIPIVEINNLDNNYTNLRLYSIKYTSYNQVPSISLILDKSIIGADSISYYDDGSIINSISLEEFTFLGSNIIIPKHINTKNNIMFLANYEEKSFDVDTNNSLKSIDTRAFSFQYNTTSTKIYNSLKEVSGNVSFDLDQELKINQSTILTGLPIVDYKHSAININYDNYNRQYNSINVGGEGPYIKYKLVRNKVGVNGFTEKDSKGKFLKDNEIYRLGIQFYNIYGQESLPKWIADFKNIVIGNQSNLNGWFASVEITLKPLFYTWLNDNNNFLDENGIYDESLKPVGYKLLRSERTISDRTILCQGLMNGMLSQVNGDRTGDDDINPTSIIKINNGLKIPSMMRRFDEYLAPMWRSKSYFRVDRRTEYHPNWTNSGSGVIGDSRNEVFKDSSSSNWSQGTYQFTKLMQMFSPEITFNILQNLSSSNLNVLGGLKNSYNAIWNQVRDTETKEIVHEAKTFNAIYPHDIKSLTPGNFQLITGEKDNLQFHGFFGHNNEKKMDFVQVNREYIEDFYKSSNNNLNFEIYGSPEISETGQGNKLYNNNAELRYSNSLQPLAADSVLSSVNSFGAKSIVFALNKLNIATENRVGIEDLFTLTGVSDTGVGLLGEFRIDNKLVYLGNIYGGNTYESKKRSNYIEIGGYNLIDQNIYNCLNSGDTFISNFKFTKLVKTDTEVYSRSSQQTTEIVNFKVETTVDLNNRNDFSISDWDNKFQPKYDEFQKYNRVYSQEPNLLLRKDLDYKFKKVNSFDTNIIATKVKVPGEIIDSWTDLQPNNTITLDGKYGPINILHKFKDELYTFQDNGLAYISIQPRVQVQGSDGISVELGTGTVLNEYKYLSTESGTLNKWSVVNSPSMFYYYDTLNNSINVFKGQIEGLSDSKGIHIWFTNNISLDELKINNPLIKKGVSSGYDYINNDMFMTFHQNNKEPFTISFNEGIQQFISFHDYIPSMYISKGDNFITTHPDINKIYQQNNGEYNNFYGTSFKSTITLMINPEADMDTVFDNIMFKSEVYINDIDQPASTLTALRLYNEYQDSGVIPLVFGRDKNLRRKFRDWNAILPRNQGTRERIRNPWVYLTLEFDNTTNKKLILHDIVVSYSV